MKRRNVESSAGKLRRVAKRSKISDGYSFIFSLKFLVVWAIVITLDFVADFRFELLYPFYVFFSNVSEIYHYKGIYYFLSYISITFALDMICYYLIPLHWLFFASTTYVWLQFTWYSDRGISLVTVFIWALLICVEALIRLRELKNALPIQFELCRPLAAHGIGYPIFTLGIGCKSYVHYRLRLHTKRIVAKENELYYSLLHKALGPEYADRHPTVGSGEQHLAMVDYPNGHANSNKYLNSNFSPNTTNQLSASTAIELHGSSAVSCAKSQTISSSQQLHSNGTMSRATSLSTNSNSSNASVRSQQTTGDSLSSDTSASRLQVRRQSLLWSILRSACLSVLFEASQIKSCISQCLIKSINSIHNLTSKVLPSNRKPVKTPSKPSISNSSSSASTSSQVSDDHTNNQSGAALGGPNKHRRGSLNDSALVDAVTEKLSNGTSNASNISKSRSQSYLNGSVNRGKSPDSSELKKSNLSRISDSSELHKSASFIESSSSSMADSMSSSSESISKKLSNISSMNISTTEGKTKSKDVTPNGTVNKSTTSMTAVSNALEMNGAISFLKSSNAGSRKHKRGSIEDQSSLLEMVKAKDDQIWKLESDNQRLKASLQTIRQCETDLRQQLSAHEGNEKTLKGTIGGLQADIDHLHKKLQSCQVAKQQDKQSIARLAKALEDEKKRFKTSADMQAASEKKARMAEESAARASAMAEAVRNVCSESCRLRQRDTELEISKLKKELSAKDEQLRHKEMITEEYNDMKDKGNMLLSALTSLREKNSQLDETLNMERLIKIDLCNHYEKTKLQLRNQRLINMELENEIRDLKRKISLYGIQPSLVMTSTGGLNLNGFGTTGCSNSTANDNIDLVNRCFSSCSPSGGSNNAVGTGNGNAASPSSLSSGTPPLSSGQSIMDCNLSPVSGTAPGGNSFSMLPPMHRDYSLDQSILGAPVWPSSLINSTSTASSLQSDLLTSVSSKQQQSNANSVNSNGTNSQMNEFDSNFAFNSRFDM